MLLGETDIRPLYGVSMHFFVIRGLDVMLLGSSKPDFIHLLHKLPKLSDAHFFPFATIESGMYKIWRI